LLHRYLNLQRQCAGSDWVEVSRVYTPQSRLLSLSLAILTAPLATQNYAGFCLLAIARTLELGPRREPPSSAEVEAVVLRHPGEFRWACGFLAAKRSQAAG
jgi:hypothetical protein